MKVDARGIWHSITVRITVAFAIASAVVLTALGVLLHQALDDSLTGRQQRPLMALSVVLQQMLDDLDDIPSLEYLEEHPGAIGHLLDSHPAMSLRIYGDDGRTLFASSRMEVPKAEWERLAAHPAGQVTMGFWEPARHSAYRLAVTRFSSKRAEIGRGFVVLAMDVTESALLLQTMQRLGLIVVPSTVLIVALIGFLIARGMLRPVAHVAESARHVTASQLNERLDLTHVPSELQDLAGSFNTMLARLEDSFRRLSEFSADLAHELRTPLTSLLGRTRLVLSKERSADEYREALELSVGEIERLAALASYMLFLAQAEHAGVVLARDQVDLRDEVDRLIEFFGIAAEERGIALEAHGRATVSGDRAMLGQALSNLLSNAIRHSPDGERVEVLLERGEGKVTASVVDRGPGLSPGDARHIFDRFYRAGPHGARHSGGAGLGLAITRSIMKMHGGEVSVKSEPGKSTVFALSLPEGAPQARPGPAASPAV